MALQKAMIHIEDIVYAIAYHRSLAFSLLQTLNVVNRSVELPSQIIAHVKKHLPKYSGNVINVRGNQMLLDALDSLDLFACGVYEPLETKIFKKLINGNDVVFDVGANIGYYTLIAAKLVGGKGRVFAFEPEPTNFSLLEKNVKLNGYKNVVLIKKAVLNKTGKTKLYLHQTAGGHSTTQSFTSNIEVETVSLDDYSREFDREIDLVKIDIEGAEPLAIRGMSSLLKRNKKLKIIMEFNPSAIGRAGFTLEQLVEPLFEQGFKAFDIRSGMEPVTTNKLKIKYEHGGLHTNLLLSR